MASEIKRVEREFILKSLMERGTPLEVHLGSERLRVVLDSYTEDRIVFSVDDERVPTRGEMQVFFRFRNNAMTFTGSVLESGAGRRVVAMPEGVYRDLARSFERIQAPEGVSVSFLHKGQQVRLNYPDSEMYESVEEPTADPGFDPMRIDNLVAEFRQRSSRYASESRIVMFRGREPQTFAERVVATTGRMLPLPLEVEGNLSLEVNERLLTQDALVGQQIDAGGDMFEVLGRIGRATEAANEKGIRQELYCPVLYNQYVVGYLYLGLRGEDEERIEAGAFDFALQFSRILAYSLKANGYFKPAANTSEFEGAQLIDISGSGLLFSFVSDGASILLYTDLELRIDVDEHQIPSRGRVMRKWQDHERTYIAVQFIQLDPDDMEILMLRIYGEEYRGDVDSVGLADPSNLAEEEF